MITIDIYVYHTPTLILYLEIVGKFFISFCYVSPIHDVITIVWNIVIAYHVNFGTCGVFAKLLTIEVCCAELSDVLGDSY